MSQTPAPTVAQSPKPAPKDAHAVKDAQDLKRDIDPQPLRESWVPKPDLHPQEQKWPAGYYADGMPAPDEQRARSAWLEGHGLREWMKAHDDRPEGQRPR